MYIYLNCPAPIFSWYSEPKKIDQENRKKSNWQVIGTPYKATLSSSSSIKLKTRWAIIIIWFLYTFLLCRNSPIQQQIDLLTS